MGRSRAVLIGRFCDLTPAQAAGIWERVGSDYGHVTIVAVPVPSAGYVTSMTIGFFGVVVLDRRDAHDARCAEAARRARQLLHLAPRRLAVDHVVVERWTDLWRLLRASRQADVVMADRRLGFVDRLLLRMNGAAW